MTQTLEHSRSAAPATAPLSAPARWALAGLSLSMLTPSLDTSIANVALPTLVQAFGASFQAAQWVVLAYLLAITSLIVSVGRLGDIFGRRRLLLTGIGVFTLASALCGLAPNLPLLIAARAVQGLGAAIMLALTLALVGETVPKGRVGSAMGLLGSMSAIGTTLGPSLGGLMIAGVGWRMIFLINLPLGVLNLILALKTLPADQPLSKTDRPRFDGVGTVLLALTLAAYALAMTLGHAEFGPLNLCLLGTAALAGALFLWAQAKVSAPLLRLEMFDDRRLGCGLGMSALVTTVVMATLVVGPFYLAGGLGLGSAQVGLVMSAGPFAAALAGAPAGRLVDRFGAFRMTVAGLTGMVVGLGLLCLAPERFGAAGYVGAIVLVTAPYALFQAANNTTIMSGARPDRRGVISGMLSLSRNLGLITGAAVMGAVFAVGSGATGPAGAGFQDVGAGMRVTLVVAMALVAVALVLAWATREAAAASEPRR